MSADLIACRSCVRIQNQFRRLRREYPEYWNLPVRGNGQADSALMILGLAPGLHGANRTGMPFTGDASGELLFRTLKELGIESSVYITNAVKCLPIRNAPTLKEQKLCARHLAQEMELHEVKTNATVLALGKIAHDALLRVLSRSPSAVPFGHGNSHDLGAIRLIDSYHCSRYNTQTGRLTVEMFQKVVRLAAQQARLIRAL